MLEQRRFLNITWNQEKPLRIFFLLQGLKSSAIIPERYDSRPDSPALAASRSRSGSSANQPSPQVLRRSNSPVVQKETDAACELHSEMSEVCMDMMARYTFAPCMSQPNRSEFWGSCIWFVVKVKYVSVQSFGSSKSTGLTIAVLSQVLSKSTP